MAFDLLVCLEKKTTAPAGCIVDTVIFFRGNQSCNQLGNHAWGVEFAALLSSIGCKVCDHIFVGISDDVCIVELIGGEIKVLEIFEKIFENRIFLFHLTEINGRVEINGTEHVM